MDPAAIGTAIIGLDHIRHETAAPDHPAARRRTPRRVDAGRRRLADVLRRTADRLAPVPAG